MRDRPREGTKLGAVLGYWEAGYRSSRAIRAIYRADHGHALTACTVCQALDRYAPEWREHKII